LGYQLNKLGFGSVGGSWEYFLWRDDLVEACKQFLSKALVDDLVALGQRHAEIGKRSESQARPAPDSFTEATGVIILDYEKPDVGRCFKVEAPKHLSKVPKKRRDQVIHLLETPGTWHLPYAMTALLFEQYDPDSVRPLQIPQHSWCEFIWDDEWVQFSKTFLSSELLSDLMNLIRKHGGAFSKSPRNRG
jgi:hypothetical protein